MTFALASHLESYGFNYPPCNIFEGRNSDLLSKQIYLFIYYYFGLATVYLNMLNFKLLEKVKLEKKKAPT